MFNQERRVSIKFINVVSHSVMIYNFITTTVLLLKLYESQIIVVDFWNHFPEYKFVGLTLTDEFISKSVYPLYINFNRELFSLEETKSVGKLFYRF